MRLWNLAKRSAKRGATAIEYALIGTLIGVVCIGSLTALGGSAVEVFGVIGTAMGGGGGAIDGGAGGGVGAGASAGGGLGMAGSAGGGSGIGGSFF